MTELFAAIVALFVAAPGGIHNAFYIDVGGRLWTMQAPQNTAYPYCVMSAPSIINDYTFNTNYLECLVQFSIFDKAADNSTAGPANALAAQTDLWALMDFAALAVSGYTLTISKRERSAPSFDALTKVAHAMTTYRIRFSK